MSARHCIGCARTTVQVILELGLQPPSNRFERADRPNNDFHPLVVGQCRACGLIQLVKPMPPGMAKSRFEWLTYNEPEGHLDDLVERLRRLPGVNSASRIAGLTYKDDSTLARFNRLGYGNSLRYDAAMDLGIQDPCAGLESIQAALDMPRAAQLVRRHGLADVLLARHVLEHAHDPAAFVRSAMTLVKPGGYVVFEMPDCTRFVRARDYSFVWEEHIAYFSRDTLAAFMGSAGLAAAEIFTYPYPLEDSLIGVVRNQRLDNAWEPVQDALKAALEDGRRFGAEYSGRAAKLQALLRAWQQKGERVAVFGAGHLATKFVNFFRLAPLIECVVDDNVRKQELLMPGSRLPIFGSHALGSHHIAYCLLSLNPESEQKVLSKNRSYLDRGGRFLSIFAASERSVYRAAGA